MRFQAKIVKIVYLGIIFQLNARYSAKNILSRNSSCKDSQKHETICKNNCLIFLSEQVESTFRQNVCNHAIKRWLLLCFQINLFLNPRL